MHNYLNICWLSFTNHFLGQLQYLLVIFLCMFDYLKNLINLISLVPVSLDIQQSTVIIIIIIIIIIIQKSICSIM